MLLSHNTSLGGNPANLGYRLVKTFTAEREVCGGPSKGALRDYGDTTLTKQSFFM